MMHQLHQTNGASLEDCHTNFFALTDLCGIKWRKFMCYELTNTFGSSILEDPVLYSFSRCLANDILCVWRRIATTPNNSAATVNPNGLFDLNNIAQSPAPPPFSLIAAKELWIFWYGEEPDISSIVSADLNNCESENGSWENGLSYECRSLLFKALHNLIERSLLSKDFIRLGKWFIQPYDSFSNDQCASAHLSFSFDFFLHGESTVCSSIDIRQHPPIYRLDKNILHLAQTGQNVTKVILAPYALTGYLTGQIARSDSQILNEWRHFYPVNTSMGGFDSNCEQDLPPLVEVMVCGARLRYPSSYVLITELDIKINIESSASYLDHLRSFKNSCIYDNSLRLSDYISQQVWAAYSGVFDIKQSPVGIFDLHVNNATKKVICSCTSAEPKLEIAQNLPVGYLNDSNKEDEDNLATDAICASPPVSSPIKTPNSLSASVVDPPMPTLSPQTPQKIPLLSMPIASTQINKQSISSSTNATASVNISKPYLKRPILKKKEHDFNLLDEENTLPWLYDYSTQEAWLNHPIKRFKELENENKIIHSSNLTSLSEMKGSPNVNIPLEVKKESEETSLEKIHTDPYDFIVSGEDILDINLNRQREENVKPSSLFTSEGLQVSYKDLDQIFDNSDTSSDDANPAQKQLSCNIGSYLNQEDTQDDTGSRNNYLFFKSDDICRVKITSSSIEYNGRSPKQIADVKPEQSGLCLLERSLRSISDIYYNVSSPAEQSIDDWTYVFQSPNIFRLASSSNYAPLASLPSHCLPPVSLPSNFTYRTSWQCTNIGEKISSLQRTIPQTIHQQQSIPNSPLTLSTPYRSSMMLGKQNTSSYDLASPDTSTTSSYMNKNINSIEADTPGTSRVPESNSTAVNILLSDTQLNIFRDHNFESCSLCVCNAGPKIVGNLKGADTPSLLNSSTHNSNIYMDEDQIRCSCGFSSIINRRLAHKSGLFYEDEMEITGCANDPSHKKKNFAANSEIADPSVYSESTLSRILDIFHDQCFIMQSTVSSLYKAAKSSSTEENKQMSIYLNQIEFNESNEICFAAVNYSKIDATVNDSVASIAGIHPWAFLQAEGPVCSADIVSLMKALQPIIQEAVHRKATRMWEAPYTVKGPLTWRQFHRLAGRGTDDRCEPQPIPAVTVGYDKDWLSLSPYAINYWEKLLLEPYAGCRDVVYVALAPHCEISFSKLKHFLRELSTTYELCRFGKHVPLKKTSNEGVFTVESRLNKKMLSTEEWFKDLEDSDVSEFLKSYSRVCNQQLVPYLNQILQEKNVFDVLDPPHSKCQHHFSTTADNLNSSECGSAKLDAINGPDEDDLELPAVVVYLIEPFSIHGAPNSNSRQLAILSLLRSYWTAIKNIPDHLRSNINLQLLSIESIVELCRVREKKSVQDEIRVLALNVFLQCRRVLSHNSNIRSLTGFGTAAAADLFLQNKDSLRNILTDQDRNKTIYKIFAPAYVLAPNRIKSEAPESFGTTGSEECSVLYLNYCLSKDQSLLLAVATDDRGEMYEMATINIDIPNRKRRKSASARRVGLQKLMDFMIGIMSQGVQPWRLVVGRVGRIGHGELKGWSWLLSRKALLKSSKHLKDICGQCSLLYPSASPCILSACLVSLEPDSTLRLMADQFTPDERFSQASVNCHLSTPRDVTCTHILVFPTSATTQSSQTAFQEQHINGPELGDDELFSALNDDMPEGMEGMGDFNDIFNVWQDPGAVGGQSPSGSPQRQENSPMIDRDNSGIGNHDGQNSPFINSGTPRVMTEQTEEVGTLLQQPLALGYLVSTAPIGKMPSWFWATCPHLEKVCPVFIKNALHLHSPCIQQSSDDLLQQQTTLITHPLDSQYTTDVLRYVLEGYNALSWLAIDFSTKDRRSCLPIQIQALIHLYYTASSFV